VLARSLLPFDHQMAVFYLVRSLHRFFPPEALESLESSAVVSFSRLRSLSDLQVADLLQKGKKTPKEQLYGLLEGMLMEVGGICSMHQGSTTSLAVFALVASFSHALQKKDDEIRALTFTAKVYDSLDYAHFASDAMLLAHGRGGECAEESLWYALKADDPVRCRHVEGLIVAGVSAEQILLVDFSRAKRTCDWPWFDGIDYRLNVARAKDPSSELIASRLMSLLPQFRLYIS